ncbi:hypothetical protein [Acinetobacter stercoris]|uniref:Uncharacterized protein n=1 Tax=Acinetobacter stercoris TaxID=2126983 RepID=A0A2U3N410_9GAMM|nr:MULTISPECIES: hypothetical protein [Acinetobacter]SPL72427.1 hypothetical protein KPC_3605 [Acinetobacter stercoris]
MKKVITTSFMILSIFGVGYVAYLDSEQQKKQEIDRIVQEAQNTSNEMHRGQEYKNNFLKLNQNI